MTLYNQIKQLEEQQQEVISTEESLQEVLVEKKDFLVDLDSKVEHYCTALREVDKQVREKGRHYHRIENYWSEEEIEGFDELKELLNGDFYVKTGLVSTKGDYIKIKPLYHQSLSSGFLAGTLVGGLFDAIAYAEGESLETLILMGGCSLLGGIILGYVCSLFSVKDPFETTAKQIEEKATYVKSFLENKND